MYRCSSYCLREPPPHARDTLIFGYSVESQKGSSKHLSELSRQVFPVSRRCASMGAFCLMKRLAEHLRRKRGDGLNRIQRLTIRSGADSSLTAQGYSSRQVCSFRCAEPVMESASAWVA